MACAWRDYDTRCLAHGSLARVCCSSSWYLAAVQVSILEPNNMKTPMLEAVPRHMAQTFDSLSPDTKAKYGEAFFQARCDLLPPTRGVACGAYANDAVSSRLFVAQKKYQTAADPTQVVDAMVNAVVMHEPLPLR